MATKETKVIISAETSKYERGMRDIKRVSQKTSQDVKKSWKDVLGVMGAISGVMGIGAVAKSFIETGITAERMGRGLEAALGSMEAGASAQIFLRKESERLGLVFENQIQDFQKLAASAKGTVLEGQAVRDIFTSMAEASTALQLSANDTSGALRAISQMISKGNVQAEELRGQLGERLPGAFQLAAKAMGKTTKELNKMLEMGQVTATDFLPKFAKAMGGQYKDSVAGASQTAQANLNRFTNSLFDMKKEFMETGALDAFTKTVKAMIPTVKMLGNQLQLIGEYWADVFTAPTHIDVTKKHIKRVKDEIKELEDNLKNPEGWKHFAGNAKSAERYAKSQLQAIASLNKQLVVYQTTLSRDDKGKPVSKPYILPGRQLEDDGSAKKIADAQEIIRLKQIDMAVSREFMAIEMELSEEEKLRIQIAEELADIEATSNQRKLEMAEEFGVLYNEIGKTQYDLEVERIQNLQQIYEDATGKRIETKEWETSELKRIDDRKKKNEESSDRMLAAQRQDTLRDMSSGFKAMSEMRGKHAKAALVAYKAMKLIEISIATKDMAVKAYNSLVGIQYVGPALATAAAGAAILFGTAQAAAVSAMQVPSYDSGGISNAKGVYQTGNIAEAHIPIPSGGKIPVEVKSDRGQQPLQIIMQNPVFQDLETQRQTFIQIADAVTRQIAPEAVVDNYNNDGQVRTMVRG